MYRFTVYCLILCLLPAPLLARPKSPAVDRDYIAALATANRFLHAWCTQDAETGILMLSDRLRQHSREADLTAFFSAPPYSQHGYELSRGRKLGPGRFAFSVALLQFTSGGSKWTRPRDSQLIVVQSSQSEWLVDKLP